MSKPRNQHWLPQFYLRRFAIPGYRKKKNAKIWLMDTDTGEVKDEKVHDVAAEEFLYSHVKADGTRCYRVEEKLAELETIIAQRIYPRIADGIPDLSSAWGIKKFTALFITSLMLRHPSVEEETQEMHRNIVTLCEQIPQDSEGRPQISQFSYKGKAFKLDTSGYNAYKAADENRLKQAFAEQIHPLAVSLTEDLFKKRWVIFCTDSPVFFTSDKPVIKQHTERRTFGIGTAGVHLWFPICPTRMLWMSDRVGDEPDGFYPLPEFEAPGLNMLTMAKATKFILSPEHPDLPLREVGIYMDQMKRDHRWQPSRGTSFIQLVQLCWSNLVQWVAQGGWNGAR